MERLDSTRILASVPFGQTVRQIWDNADLGLKQSLIGLLVVKIVIKPGRPGGKRWTDENTGRSWQFDPSNLEIKWKS
jgi:hypothetical protein